MFSSLEVQVLRPTLVRCKGYRIPPLDAIPARTEPSASRNSQNNYPSLMLTLKKVLKTIYFLWAAIPGGVVFETTFQVEGGALRVPTGAGLGVEVDEGKVRHASRG